MKTCLIVIVNYRTGGLVVDCLASLAPDVIDHPGVQVMVVDNASGDGSADLIATEIAARGWSRWARVMRSAVNGGFAYGNNLAIRHALGSSGTAPDYIWILNPDTVVRGSAIRAIFDFFAATPAAGVIGTAIDDRTGNRWPYAFRFHSLLGEIESALRWSIVTRMVGRRSAVQRMGDRPARVDWVSGASAVFRREVFEAAGLFDEEYFLYFEETDFLRRVHATGWECWYVPAAVIMHISGQSTGVTSEDAASRPVPDYWFASRRRYLIKNHGRAYAMAADGIVIVGEVLWRLRCRVAARPHGGPPGFLRTFAARSAMFRGSIAANDRLVSVAQPPSKPGKSPIFSALF